MRTSVSLAFLLVAMFSERAAAEESCPWLNAATAGGALTAAVTTAVTHETANRDDAVCTFTGERSRLRIEVRTMDTPRTELASRAAQCSENPEALRAIGNEAVVCGSKGSAQLVGRVRNRLFVVVVTADDPSARLREKARAVAESVAGNLF